MAAPVQPAQEYHRANLVPYQRQASDHLYHPGVTLLRRGKEMKGHWTAVQLYNTIKNIQSTSDTDNPILIEKLKPHAILYS